MLTVGWVLVKVGPFEDYANNVTAAAADTVLLLRVLRDSAGVEAFCVHPSIARAHSNHC